jgi:multiple sugar transport system permease protein
VRPGGRSPKEVHPYLLILPSFLLTAFIIAYPLVDLATTSVHAVTRFGQVRGFVGPGNFASVLADPLFAESLLRTLEWTVGVVGGTILVSLPVALMLNLSFIGRGVARGLVMLPWAVSLTMSAIVWRWTLNGESGLLNLTLQELGLIKAPIIWLANGDTAFPMEIFIGILVSIPFTVTILLGGLASLPADIYEAAAMEGAGNAQQFRTLTLPLLWPFLNIAIVLNVIYVFNSFPIIWVLTEGGPANSTDILVTYLYKLAFVFGRMGDAAAVSLLMFAILLGFTLIYLRLAHRGGRDD